MKYSIILLFTIVLNSCTEPEPPVIESKFRYINKCGYEVDFKSFGDEYSSFTVMSDAYFERINKEEGVIGSGPFYGDSLEIVFNGTKHIIYHWKDDSLRNPLLLESYNQKKISNYQYEFTYIITEQDYLNALD